MRARIRIIIGKTRRYWPIVGVLAVISLLVFVVINLTFNDRNGKFDNVSDPAYVLEVPTGRDALTHLSIEADDVTLELGISGNLSKPQVMLFGDGYSDQSVKTDIYGTRCTLKLEGETATPESMTMRVLLPESHLRAITIEGDQLNLRAVGLRSDLVNAEVGSGYGYFANMKANNVRVSSESASLRFTDNRMVSLNAKLKDGSITSLDNSIKAADIVIDKGDFFAYARRWSGMWNVSCGNGSITALTQYRPYNIMISAMADPYGSVVMDYSKRFWEHADIVENTDKTYSGSVGGSVNKSMDFSVERGAIYIGKRTRYSDLDPLAGDYPYADSNPYLKERGTAVK